MKTSDLRAWGMAGAFAATLVVGCAQKRETAQSQAVAWNTSVDAALADAGRTGRPIRLDFYTAW